MRYMLAGSTIHCKHIRRLIVQSILSSQAERGKLHVDAPVSRSAVPDLTHDARKSSRRALASGRHQPT
ncbi:hypothetical protein CupriaWKF_31715 [Cupriavidus sp. WKF15]|uniref:hypothetical protein n=1 Tax=Cupriavidus sp. WKF15 TaxID=3032282 RepID=UPI0023E33F0E|nr:hypothetical protein [Cupriavidus sp. WKF15]WER50899.1 hypothetical protein CupriaWKF_31715 [Cupriavidus sp. WKF15]